MLFAWIKARWPEVSTKIGLVLGALSTAIAQFAPIKPELAYAGLAVSALLVLLKENPNG